MIMNQVLILTRNILNEQEIQQKLQVLNYEVYCSANHFEDYNQQVQTPEVFKFFQYVILSESICESEVKALVPVLRKQSVNIIRKVDTNLTTVDQEYLETEQIHAIISAEDSVDELRECLYSLKKKMGAREETYHNDKVVQLSGKVSLIRPNYLSERSMTQLEIQKFADTLHRLSPIEARLISILIKSEDQVVTREELCRQIWNEEVTKSHLASLSSMVTRIKDKFEHTPLENAAIHTLWGKGYRVNPELLELIQNDEYFNRIVMNG